MTSGERLLERNLFGERVPGWCLIVTTLELLLGTCIPAQVLADGYAIVTGAEWSQSCSVAIRVEPRCYSFVPIRGGAFLFV